jgi:hypothetical protein
MENKLQECSGCGTAEETVDRNMFDGMCADCTEKALFDSDFAEKAYKRNEELINETSAQSSIK